MDEKTRNQVVVHYKDGSVLKGFTHDFTPLKNTFHLNVEMGPQAGEVRDVLVAELKAIFFVKSFEGNRTYVEKKLFEQVNDARLRGLKIRVEFKDGEVVRGISLGYSKGKRGFFLIPIDPECNNDRIYVLADACNKIQVGDLAKV